MKEYKIKAQPVVNKKGKIVSGSIKIQSVLFEPYCTYTLTAVKNDRGNDKRD